MPKINSDPVTSTTLHLTQSPVCPGRVAYKGAGREKKVHGLKFLQLIKKVKGYAWV